MATDIRTVALSTAQRILVGRLMAGRAAGEPVTISADETATFLTPEVAAILDGVAVPEEERRDPMLHLIERPALAEPTLRRREVYLVEGHSALV